MTLNQSETRAWRYLLIARLWQNHNLMKVSKNEVLQLILHARTRMPRSVSCHSQNIKTSLSFPAWILIKTTGVLSLSAAETECVFTQLCFSAVICLLLTYLHNKQVGNNTNYTYVADRCALKCSKLSILLILSIKSPEFPPWLRILHRVTMICCLAVGCVA